MTGQQTKTLPAEFADLQDLAGHWSLATAPERRVRRNGADMSDIDEFYKRMMARIEQILAYLNQFDLEQMPADAGNLMAMVLSLAEIGTAAEVYRQPTVIDGFPTDRFA